MFCNNKYKSKTNFNNSRWIFTAIWWFNLKQYHRLVLNECLLHCIFNYKFGAQSYTAFINWIDDFTPLRKIIIIMVMILHYTFLTAFFFLITISLLFQFMQLQLEVHAAEDLSPSSINLKPK